MRIKSICNAFILALLFVSTISAQDFLYSRAEPCPFPELFQEARVRARAMPVTHSIEIVSYVETQIHQRGVTVRKNSDFSTRTIPIVFLNTSTCELVSTTLTRSITNRSVPTMLVTDDGRFLVLVEPRPYGTLWNWWNTPFQVFSPEGWVVAAIHWKRHPSGESVTYTPGSADMMNAFPTLPEIGRHHIREDMEQAYISLKDVPSHFSPNMTVPNVMRTFFPQLLESIISIEHADDYEVTAFRNGAYHVNPINRPFAIIGANPNEAFAPTGSKAGARGLMQIMPATCADMRTRYHAGIPDGCYQAPHGHPVELATAMLVIDYHLSILSKKLRRPHESLEEFASRKEIRLMLRASYNTGPGRVSRAVQTRADWAVVLLSETRGYLVKAFGLD